MSVDCLRLTGGLELCLEHLCSPMSSLSSLPSVSLALISGPSGSGNKLTCSFNSLSQGGMANRRTYYRLCSWESFVLDTRLFNSSDTPVQ